MTSPSFICISPSQFFWHFVVLFVDLFAVFPGERIQSASQSLERVLIVRYFLVDFQLIQ